MNPAAPSGYPGLWSRITHHEFFRGRDYRLNTAGREPHTFPWLGGIGSPSTATRGTDMPKFVIERELKGAGMLARADLQAVSQKSCGVLQNMGPTIQWVQSFVTDDKIYCVYIAPDEAAVRQHAIQGGFPANSIAQVRSTIDPTTAE
jgi:Protein of unknown function (DUF4242)